MGPSWLPHELKSTPDIRGHVSQFASILRAHRGPTVCPAQCRVVNSIVHHHEVGLPLPQGSSLLPELCCLEPSSLNRPHPPHSWAHRDFTARRLIRDVFAVRERLSDPRVVPSFRCSFLPDMPPSPTPGSSDIVSSKLTMPTWSSPREHWLDTPDTSTIRFTWAFISGLH
jgi:hypothetical protein